MEYQKAISILKSLLDRHSLNAEGKEAVMTAIDVLSWGSLAKGKATSTQQIIRKKRNGVFCKYLEKNFHIVIGTPNHCKNYFEVNQGNCNNNSPNQSNSCPRVSSN